MTLKQKWELFVAKIKELEKLKQELIDYKENDMSFGDRKLKQKIEHYCSVFLRGPQPTNIYNTEEG